MKNRIVSFFCFLALLLTGCSSPGGASSSSSAQSSSYSQESLSSDPQSEYSEDVPSSLDGNSSSLESSAAPTSSDEPYSSLESEDSFDLESSDEESSAAPASSDEPYSSLESEDSFDLESSDEESSSTSVETDKRLYVFVTYSDVEGFYDIYIDAKIETKVSNLFVESVIVLDEGIEIETSNLQWYLYEEHLGNLYFGENIVEIGKLMIGFSIPYPQVHFGKGLRRIEYFHVSLDWETMVSSIDDNRLDIYFGGDCPEMDDGTLYNNGFSGMMLHYHQGAKGFKTFMQSGSAICIEDEAYIPDLSIGDYVLETNRKARAFAKSIYDRSVEIGNDEFLLFPVADLGFYFQLKDFTLDLTKDCTSNYEKARVIFDWIVDNIEYSDDYMTASVEEVFNDRKAVCAGYAFLYHDMLAGVGIPSFYTRGAPIYALPTVDTESFVRASFDPSEQSVTHGWVYAIIDGEAVCCDPTWGEFDISDEYLSTTRLIFQVDGVRILYDDRLYPLIRGIAIVAYEGNYYFVEDGVGSASAEFSMTVNYVLNLRFRLNLNSKVTHGRESFSSTQVIPYGSIYHDGLFYIDDPDFVLKQGFNFWWYCMSDGKAIDFLLLLRYMNEETKRYGTAFQNQFDLGFCFMYEGMMYLEYEMNKLTLFAAIDMPTSFTVPTEVKGKKVTALGEGCFERMDSLEEIILPEGLEWMAGSCFSWCSSLTSITVPSTVTEFGTCMFDYCPSLTEVHLPEGMTCIPNGTFVFDTALEHIDLPSTITKIEDNSFGNCTALKSIALPEGLETIEEKAFYFCTALEEISIPENVKEIGSAAFGCCPDIASLDVDPDNPYFDSRQGCNAIIRSETDTLVSACKATVIPEGILGIEDESFSGILGIEELAIPTSVTFIGDLAFYACEKLSHVDFGQTSGLKTIGRYAFYCCFALEEAILPEGLETIEECAFSDCQSLEKLTFPSTIRNIGTWIAFGASKLTEASYRGSVEDWEKVEKDPKWHYRTSCTVVHCQNGAVQLA